jgi:hypothetical protein
MSDMERFYSRLKQEGKLPAGTPFNVTGYSLGGHLALGFALMRRDEGNERLLKHVYTFNGAGTGDKARGIAVTTLVKNFDRLRDLIAHGAAGIAGLGDVKDAQRRVQEVLAERQRLEAFPNRATTFSNGEVPQLGSYQDLAHQLAAVLVGKKTTASQSFLPMFGVSTAPLSRQFAPTEPFENMTEIFGADGGESGTSLVQGRFSFVSFSGFHYSKEENSFGVYIEDQPLTRGDYDLARDRGTVLRGYAQPGAAGRFTRVAGGDYPARPEYHPISDRGDFQGGFNQQSHLDQGDGRRSRRRYARECARWVAQVVCTSRRDSNPTGP